MIVLAVVCGAAAVFIGVLALAGAKSPAVPARLNRLERNGPGDRGELLAEPFAARVGMPVAQRLRNLVTRLLPGSWVSGIEYRLMLAGEPLSVHAMLTVQVVAVAAGVFVVFVAVTGGGGAPRVAATLVAGAVLGVMPLYWLRIRVAARKRALLKALPDAVDLIVTTVEAGLGLDAALSEVGHETEGPLGEELRLTVRETTLGRSRRDALTRLIERTDVPELKTFVQAVIQAEQTGIPVGQVLRTQAAQIRLKKRQRAEAEAQRAPVKMVVVLALLVLPAMLLMVIGPAGIRMTEQF
ncbi:MAG: type II secretion system F family protein [Dehalococcoidia bacterium]|nr:type II secretion system F family protein [Dehalococcoidia bacterium]